jgi:hypothetical protein
MTASRVTMNRKRSSLPDLGAAISSKNSDIDIAGTPDLSRERLALTRPITEQTTSTPARVWTHVLRFNSNKPLSKLPCGNYSVRAWKACFWECLFGLYGPAPSLFNETFKLTVHCVKGLSCTVVSLLRKVFAADVRRTFVWTILRLNRGRF